jgi:hypothetical protein
MPPVKLYVCWGTFPPDAHPCRAAHNALREAGHDPEVKRAYGSGRLPDALNVTPGRREVKRLTGSTWVPTLVLDDGTVVDGSENIVEWARAHPAA